MLSSWMMTSCCWRRRMKWVGWLLVFLVDGVLIFQTLVDYFGSYALVEISLLLLVILPTLVVYKLTKE